MTLAPFAIPAAGRSSGASLRQELIAALDEARARTLLLVERLTDEELHLQYDPLMSPIMWDLGHIARFEELWLVRNLDGPVEFGEMPGMYNPFEHPRRVRGALALPTLDECLQMMRDIRERVLSRMDSVDFDGGHTLLRDGYVYAMVLQHEYQHNETILQTLQLKTGRPYAAPRAIVPPMSRGLAARESMVRFPGGPAMVGTEDRTAAYDNERPLIEVDLAPFWIDVAPVTNGQFIEFIAAGGYSRREWWSDPGWQWLGEEGVGAPKYWWREGDRWHTRTMDRAQLVDERAPVCHVSFHEAEAFARFAGKRLPTEQEWEVAASWGDPPRRYPWGDTAPTTTEANVDQLSFGPAPVGAYASNWSSLGCYGMIGDVWEWTSSDFRPYPGFEPFPYPEYSQVFFGNEYKVLRGGSWATRPGAVRNTFRNWDYPIRRQIFSGLRCARDG